MTGLSLPPHGAQPACGGVRRQRAGGVPDATLTSAVPGASTALDQETRGLDTVVSKVLYGQVGFR